MGVIGTIGKIILFPFKLIFGPVKKKENSGDALLANAAPITPLSQIDIPADNAKAKIDLMLAQVDSLKLEYEAINQRIQNIERMVRELYTMAKS